jgi:hypothetical protein
MSAELNQALDAVAQRVLALAAQDAELRSHLRALAQAILSATAEPPGAAPVRAEPQKEPAAPVPAVRARRPLKDIKPLHPLIQEVAQGSLRQKQPPAIEGSGWVVKSLEAALWAFHDAATFEEAVLRAVNLGDDADTTGAICGQLAGAFWG